MTSSLLDPNMITLPCKSLYRFYQHSINSQWSSFLKLVQREELSVLVNDKRRPCVVDAVATILVGDVLLLREKESPENYDSAIIKDDDVYLISLASVTAFSIIGSITFLW